MAIEFNVFEYADVKSVMDATSGVRAVFYQESMPAGQPALSIYVVADGGNVLITFSASNFSTPSTFHTDFPNAVELSGSINATIS